MLNCSREKATPIAFEEEFIEWISSFGSDPAREVIEYYRSLSDHHLSSANESKIEDIIEQIRKK